MLPITHKPRRLFVSGRLELISVSGSVGQWLHFDGRWYRELDSATFNWLRSQIESAKQSGMAAEAVESAAGILNWIRDTGLFWGQLDALELDQDSRADGWQWSDGCPRWVETMDF